MVNCARTSMFNGNDFTSVRNDLSLSMLPPRRAPRSSVSFMNTWPTEMTAERSFPSHMTGKLAMIGST